MWLGIITTLSLMPADVDTVSLFSHQDKLVHCIFYLGMAWFLGRTGYMSGPLFALKLLIVAGSYGILMECLQGIMGRGRHFDIFDIIANIIGALIGTLLIMKLRSKARTRA